MPARAKCAQCGEAKPPHRICRECGHYAGALRIEIADEA
jgi:ribosomal protein L32